MRNSTDAKFALSHPAYREARFCVREWELAISRLLPQDMDWLRSQINSYFEVFANANPDIYLYLRSGHLELIEAIIKKEQGIEVILG